MKIVSHPFHRRAGVAVASLLAVTLGCAEDDAAPEPVGEPVACGPSLECAPDSVCVIECLCCGVDTGNPADQQTSYACAKPEEACDGPIGECVSEERGCFLDADGTCLDPCA